ncbi:hypothetical protein ACSVNO_05950 [Salmonella enterica]|uniref:hypothetical protein n=1 Tax=Salmonella enterica TaxID=28901 RepID=UPI003F3DCCF3
MKKVTLSFLLCFFSMNTLAKSIPPIDNIKANISHLINVKKTDWSDEKTNGVLTLSTVTKSGVKAALQPDRMGVFIKVSVGEDRKKGLNDINKALRKCLKIVSTTVGGLTDAQKDRLGDLINASMKVSGYLVSDVIAGYDFNSAFYVIDSNAIIECGIRNFDGV